MTDNARINIREEGRATTIEGAGSLVLWNSEDFGKGLKRAALEADSVTVDLREADFIDTAIIQYLAIAAVTLNGRGKRLKVLVSESGHPRRAFEITGLTALMDMEVVPKP